MFAYVNPQLINHITFEQFFSKKLVKNLIALSARGKREKNCLREIDSLNCFGVNLGPICVTSGSEFPGKIKLDL